jgi:hypothetical protein
MHFNIDPDERRLSEHLQKDCQTLGFAKNSQAEAVSREYVSHGWHS